MKLDIEEDRSIASLRTLEPKLKNVSKIPKAKKTRPTKKHLEDNNHYHLGELLRKYKAEKLMPSDLPAKKIISWHSKYNAKISSTGKCQFLPENPFFLK